MGLYGSFKLARPEVLERLLAHPEDMEDYVEETGIGGSGPDPGMALEIEKTWHGIHFLLTGTAGAGQAPLDFIIRGGRPFNGHAGASAFTVDQVREISRALEPIEPESLRERFDPDRMEKLKIYPELWAREEEAEDLLDSAVESFEMLKEFLQKGANEGFGMIMLIS